MTLATVRVILEFLREYGPMLKQAGVALKDLYDYIDSHRDHPGLTDAERRQIEGIFSAAPETLGGFSFTPTPVPVEPEPEPEPVEPPVVPPVEPPATEAVYPHYGEILGTYPDISKLAVGDTVYRVPGGKYCVEPTGLGRPVPADWVLVLTVGF